MPSPVGPSRVTAPRPSAEPAVAVAAAPSAGFTLVTVFAASILIYGLGFLLTGAVSPWLWGAPFWRIGLDLLYAVAGFLVACAWFNPPPPLLAASRRRLCARAAGLYAAYAACISGTVLVIGPLATPLSWRAYAHSPVTGLYLHNLLFQPALFLPGVFRGLEWNAAVNPIVLQVRLLLVCSVALAALGILSRGPRVTAVAVGGVVAAATYLALFTHPSWPMVLLDMDAREVTVEIPFFCVGALLSALDTRAGAWRADLAMLAFFANWMVSAWFVQWNIVVEWVTLPYMAACFGRMRLPGTRWIGDPTAGLVLFSFPLQQLVVQRLPGHLAHAILLCAVPSLVAGLASWHLIERPVQRIAASLLNMPGADAAQ